jgi:hypothetical protein
MVVWPWPMSPAHSAPRKAAQAACHSFVQAFSGDIDAVLDAIDVATADSATPERHPNGSSMFAIYSPTRRDHLWHGNASSLELNLGERELLPAKGKRLRRNDSQLGVGWIQRPLER